MKKVSSFILFLLLLVEAGGAQIELRRYDIAAPPPNFLHEYWRHARTNWQPAATSFLAGYAGGMADVLAHHHSSSVFAELPPDHFFGRESWRRKWRFSHDGHIIGEAFPGSSSVLVWTTDAWHLANTTQRSLVRVGLFARQGDRRFWVNAVDFIFYSALYGAGHTLAQKTLRRP